MKTTFHINVLWNSLEEEPSFSNRLNVADTYPKHN